MLKMIELSEGEVQALQALNAGAPCSPYGDGFSTFCEYARSAKGCLSLRLLDVLVSMRAVAGHAGALLLRQVPIRLGIGKTPSEPFPYASSPGVGTEAALLAMALRLGEPVGFEAWHGGALIQNFYPVHALAAEQCASNSVYLELHTE